MPMSPGEFRVALGELRRATDVVRSESAHISGLIDEIQQRFDAAQDSWRSPSGATFATMSAWFTTASRDLEALLEETVRRMETAYRNYADAETANTHNSGG
ncbi:WXG100 family type VII secretion target [Streptomyces sp. NPDC086010]|uniref:WXG100 family type VII secretion target n=2 Tax=unclassified Streptomyces TaxID=2593676 RepID=UPI0037D67AC7